MSVSKRVFSGSVASWCTILVSFLARFFFVPIFLAYWNSKIFGVWLALEAFMGLTRLLDTCHQTFLQNEFLRLGTERRGTIRKYLWSSILFAFLLGLIQFAVVLIIVYSGSLNLLMKVDDPLYDQVGLSLVIISVEWLISGSVGGIAVRVVLPFGHYPRMAWWGLTSRTVTAVFPVLAVLMGGEIVAATCGLVLGRTVVNIFLFIDLWAILKREKLTFCRMNWNIGVRNFYYSQVYVIIAVFEMVRQQGMRLLLTPLAGIARMASFSMMRSGSTLALNGLATIVDPVLPELMRYLNNKDQVRSEAAFGTVWLMLAGAMAPAVVVLQVFIEPLFKIWTRGKIPFDPFLFAILSSVVLIFALAQPAMGTVKGNNLLKPQLIITVITGSAVVGGMFLLVHRIGILGAAISLIVAEFLSVIGYVYAANRMMKKSGLVWPWKSFMHVISSVLAASAGMACIAVFPKWSYSSAVACLMILVVLFYFYWRSLPEFVQSWGIDSIIRRLPAFGIKKMTRP